MQFFIIQCNDGTFNIGTQSIEHTDFVPCIITLPNPFTLFDGTIVMNVFATMEEAKAAYFALYGKPYIKVEHPARGE